MNNQKVNLTKDKGALLTLLGIAVMIIMTATKILPNSKIAGYSVFVGLAFFFIVEAMDKVKGNDSGLRFSTFFEDLKKPGVIALVLLPIATGIAALLIGNLIFRGEFVGRVLGRAGEILSFDKAALLAVQVVIAAFGEEIAYRGFFLGKGEKFAPFWVCAVVSSAVFAAGHIAAGSLGIAVYDVAGVFIDSMIFSIIYKKTGNCLISTVSHILGNTASLAAGMILF